MNTQVLIKIISEDDESYDADELLNECYDSIPCNNNKKINK